MGSGDQANLDRVVNRVKPNPQRVGSTVLTDINQLLPLTGIISVGRLDSNHIAIDNLCISKQHISLKKTNRGIEFAANPDATNGSFYYGEEKPIKDGKWHRLDRPLSLAGAYILEAIGNNAIRFSHENKSVEFQFGAMTELPLSTRPSRSSLQDAHTESVSLPSSSARTFVDTLLCSDLKPWDPVFIKRAESLPPEKRQAAIHLLEQELQVLDQNPRRLTVEGYIKVLKEASNS